MIRQVDSKSDGDFHDELLEVVESDMKNIFVCSSVTDLPEILLQAQQVGLMTEEHHFIVSSLDFHTIDLEPFQYGETAITGYRMVLQENPLVEEVTEFFISQHLKLNDDRENNESNVIEQLSADKLLLENALIYDAGENPSEDLKTELHLSSFSVGCIARHLTTYRNEAQQRNVRPTPLCFLLWSIVVQFNEISFVTQRSHWRHKFRPFWKPKRFSAGNP